MREIKFRVWNKTYKKMSYDDSDWINGLAYQLDTGFEIMQYTGLKDKNDKEIYEGDIIKCNIDMIDKKGNENLIVSYDLPKLGFSFSGLFIFNMKLLDNTKMGHDIEVIGNIYENPELLK